MNNLLKMFLRIDAEVYRFLFSSFEGGCHISVFIDPRILNEGAAVELHIQYTATFSRLGPGSKLSSRDIILPPKKSLLRGGGGGGSTFQKVQEL